MNDWKGAAQRDGQALRYPAQPGTSGVGSCLRHWKMGQKTLRSPEQMGGESQVLLGRERLRCLAWTLDSLLHSSGEETASDILSQTLF